MKKFLFFFVSIAVILSSTSCEKGPTDICTPTFNIDQFEENLIDELDGQVMGYAYVITKNGTVVHSGADGNARAGQDGQKDMSIFERMQVASISKNITTVAVLSVLEEKNIDVNTPIEDYLPPHWDLGPGSGDITIYELLNQSPGLNVRGTQSFNATQYDSLQFYIAQGAQQPKTRTYSNTHHGLFRVILPLLWDVPRPADGNYDEEFCNDVYKDAVQALVFDKININNADCTNPNNNPMQAYSGPNDNAGSGGTSDFTAVAGGIGWTLSAEEIAKYWAYVWNTDDIIDGDSRDLMRDNELGLWNTINSGDYGKYYCKLGGWGFGNGDTMDSAVIQYPDGVQLTLFCNSQRVNGKGLTVIGRDAYDDAVGCF